MKLALTWNALHKVYAGLIGKSIFIISLVIPVAKLNGLGFHLHNYNFYLIGAIIISIGFIIEKISLPVVLGKFEDPISYASHLLERNRSEAFDDRFEFTALYRYDKQHELVEKAELGAELAGVAIEKNASSILGINKFIYYFGVLNFLAIDVSKYVLRLTCTVFFIVGGVIFYFPMILAILNYFGVIHVA
jgi:hypothetical protein